MTRKKRLSLLIPSYIRADIQKPITDKLDEMGIQYDCFFDVAPTPLSSARRKVWNS